MAEEIVKILRIDTKNSGKSLKDLKNQLKDLKKALESATIGSKEYETTLALMAKAQQEYADATVALKANTLASTDALQNVSRFGKDLAKSYSSISAATSLITGGNEDLNKAMLKVARTIQMIQGLDGFSGVFKRLPEMTELFRRWVGYLSPVKQSIDDIGSSISKLDGEGLDALKQIAQGNTNINVSSKATAESAITREVEALKQLPQVINQETGAGNKRNIMLAEQEQLYTTLLKRREEEASALARLQKIKKELEKELPEAKWIKEQEKQIKISEEAIQRFETLQKTGGEVTDEFLEQYNKIALSTAKVRQEIAEMAEEMSPDKIAKLAQYDQVVKELNQMDAAVQKTGKQIAEFEQGLNKTSLAAQYLSKTFKTAFSSIALMGAITLLLGALGKLWSAVQKYIEKIREARKAEMEFQKTLKEGASGAASQIVVLEKLSRAYKKLGDSAEEKKKFIADYADEIKKTGIAVDTVNVADDVFVNNTSIYIEALKARARAQAAENLAIKEYEKNLKDRAELEVKLEEARNKKKQYTDFQNSGIEGLDTTIPGRFDKGIEEMEKTLDELDEKSRKTIERLYGVVEEETATANAILQPLEEAAKAHEEYLKAEADAEAEAQKAREKAAADRKKQLEDEAAQRQKDLAALKSYYEEAERILAESINNEIQAITQKYNDEIELAKKYGRDVTELELARDKEIADAMKRTADEQFDTIQKNIDRINREYEIASLRNPVNQGEYTRRTTGLSLLLGLGGDKNSVDNDYGRTAGKYGSYITQYQTKDQVNEEYKAQVQYNDESLKLLKERLHQENEQLEAQLSIEGLAADKRQEIERQLQENIREESDATLETERANTQAYMDLQEKKREALNGVLTVASSVTGGLAQLAKLNSQNDKKSEKERERAQKAYKALATTQAIIDTYKAANEAYASMASIPYVGPALGAAASAAAIISGMASVKAIMQESMTISQQPQGVEAPAAIDYPVAYTRNLLGDKELSEINKPIKCWVLDREIDDSLSRLEIRQNNASF